MKGTHSVGMLYMLYNLMLYSITILLAQCMLVSNMR